MMNYKTAVIKRNIELVLMLPFVLLGKLAGKVFRLKTQHDIFLFFPKADIGGSIKVNADIAECIKDRKPLIIFSKKPFNNEFRHLFDIEGVRVIDLHKYVDRKVIHFMNFFFRGVLAAWINERQHPVVFGGESMYFYKVIPHVKKNTKVIELCHLNSWFNFSQAFIKYIDKRVFSSPQIKREVEAQYKRNNIGKEYLEKLDFTDNQIPIPGRKETNNKTLEVLFVGRGAPQKRVHLIAETARVLHNNRADIHFSFVGDVEDIVPKEVQGYSTMYGNIKDSNKLSRLYDESDVLILLSTTEGLPIVVMEMMARAKVILSTAVGGIPDYIQHEKGGLLIYETEEQKIIEKAAEYLILLHHDREMRKKMGEVNYTYASSHFSHEHFCGYYRALLTHS